MDTKKMIKKQEKQEDIIILDKGIDANGEIEILSWVCCAASIWPYRLA